MKGIKVYMKICYWMCLILSEIPRSRTLVSSSEFSTKEGDNNFFDTFVKNIEGNITAFGDQLLDGCCCIKQEIARKSFFDSIPKLTPGKIMIFGMDFFFLVTSAQRLYLREFPCWNIAALAATIIVPALPIPDKENLSTTVSVIDKTYLSKIYSYLTFQKGEQEILPPPEDHPLDKLFKRFFPEIDVKYSPTNWKEIAKSIIERTGITENALYKACFLAFFTSLFLQFIIVRDTKEKMNSKENEFTVEELLEEYDDMPEFREILEEWLTPRRQRKYDEEKDTSFAKPDHFTDFHVISTAH